MSGALHTSDPGPRFDGLYQHREEHHSSFLKFSKNGVVEQASVGVPNARELEPMMAARLMATRGVEAHNQGEFSIQGENVVFSTTSAEGTVDYRGVITPQGDLVLESHSQINDRRYTGIRYGFVEFTFPAPYKPSGSPSAMFSLEDRIGQSIIHTVNQIKPGEGKGELRHAHVFLGDVQQHFGRKLEAQVFQWAVPVYVCEEDLRRDPMTTAKRRAGVIAVSSESCILGHAKSLGRTQALALPLSVVHAEPVTLEVKGESMPAFRLSAEGVPVLGLGLKPIVGGEAKVAVMIRDRIVEMLNSHIERGEAKGPADVILALAWQLMELVLIAVKADGVRAGFTQVFDSEPTTDDPASLEGATEQLQREGARAVIAARFDEGFGGVAGFTCVTEREGAPMILLETFDAATGKSFSLSCGLRRSPTGSYEPTANPVLHGAAEPLDRAPAVD